MLAPLPHIFELPRAKILPCLVKSIAALARTLARQLFARRLALLPLVSLLYFSHIFPWARLFPPRALPICSRLPHCLRPKPSPALASHSEYRLLLSEHRRDRTV